MNSNKSKIDLNTLRQNIDLIDLELLELIKKRFEIVLDV
jgi:chorismate mutase